MSQRLSKTQQYAILWMVDNKKTDTEIIKELQISADQLTKFLEKHKKASESNKIPTTTSNSTRAKDMMIRKTSGKNNSGVSIMTKEASQVGDAFHQSIPTSTRLDSIIHRPNG